MFKSFPTQILILKVLPLSVPTFHSIFFQKMWKGKQKGTFASRPWVCKPCLLAQWSSKESLLCPPIFYFLVYELTQPNVSVTFIHSAFWIIIFPFGHLPLPYYECYINFCFVISFLKCFVMDNSISNFISL